MSYDTVVNGFSPVMRAKLGDAFGSGTVADDTGNGHTGTVHGSVTLGQAGIIPALGLATAAMTGGNDTDYIDFGTAGAILPTTGTLLVWFKSPSSDPNSIGTGLRMLFGQQGGASIDNYDGAGSLGAYDYVANTFRATSSLIADGSGHMLALTYQLGVSNGSQIYLDGSAVGAAFTLGNAASGLPLRVGWSNFAGQAAAGTFQDAMVFGSALTSGNISTIYAAGATPIALAIRMQAPAIAVGGSVIPLFFSSELGSLTNPTVTVSHLDDGTGLSAGSISGGDSQALGSAISATLDYTVPSTGSVAISFTNNQGLLNELIYIGMNTTGATTPATAANGWVAGGVHSGSIYYVSGSNYCWTDGSRWYITPNAPGTLGTTYWQTAAGAPFDAAYTAAGSSPPAGTPTVHAYTGTGTFTLQVQDFAPPVRPLQPFTTPPNFDPDLGYSGNVHNFFPVGQVPTQWIKQGSHATAYRARDYFTGALKDSGTIDASAGDVQLTFPHCTDPGVYKVSYSQTTVDPVWGQALGGTLIGVYSTYPGILPDVAPGWGKRDDSATPLLPGYFGGTGQTFTTQNPIVGSASSPFTSPFYARFGDPNDGGGTITPTATGSIQFRLSNTGGYRLTVNGQVLLNNLTGTVSFDVTSKAIAMTAGVTVPWRLDRAVIQPSGSYTGDSLQWFLNGVNQGAVPSSWFNNAVGSTPNHVPVTYFDKLVTGQQADNDAVAHAFLGMGIQRFEINRIGSPTNEITAFTSELQYLASLPVDPQRPVRHAIYIINYRRKVTTTGSVIGGATTIPLSNATLFEQGSVIKLDDGAGHVETRTVATSNHSNQITLTAGVTTGFGSGALVYNDPAAEDAQVTSAVSTISAILPTAPIVVPWNEPDINPGNLIQTLAPEAGAAVMPAFRATVKAGNANALVCVPVTVDILPRTTSVTGWMAKFFAAGGGTYADAIGFHIYNGLDGEIIQLRKEAADLRALVRQYGLQALPWYQLEQSYSAANYGTYDPGHQSRWSNLQIEVMEQFGMPMEASLDWHEFDDGDANFKHQVINDDPTRTIMPYGLTRRTRRGLLAGRKFSEQLNFGSADDILIGSRYSGPGVNDRLSLQSAGDPDATVKLSVTGGDGTVHLYNCFGKTSSVPVVSGVATVTGLNDPVYVDVQPSQQISVLPDSWGTNYATGATLSTSGNATGLSKITDGNTYLYYYNGTTPWNDGVDPVSGGTPSNFPVTVELDLPAPQIVDFVALRCPAPWQAQATLLSFKIDTFNAGVWTTQYTYKRIPTLIGSAGAFADSTVPAGLDVYWDAKHVWQAKFASPVNASKFRVVVERASFGGGAGRAAVEGLGQGWGFPAAEFQSIGIYNTSGVRTPPGGGGATATGYPLIAPFPSHTGQAANIVCTISDVNGNVVQTVSAGWSELLDGTGVGAGYYVNGITAPDPTAGPFRRDYKITGVAGAIYSEFVGYDTASMQALGYTQARAVKLDNSDAPTSSRMKPGDIALDANKRVDVGAFVGSPATVDSAGRPKVDADAWAGINLFGTSVPNTTAVNVTSWNNQSLGGAAAPDLIYIAAGQLPAQTGASTSQVIVSSAAGLPADGGWLIDVEGSGTRTVLSRTTTTVTVDHPWFGTALPANGARWRARYGNSPALTNTQQAVVGTNNDKLNYGLSTAERVFVSAAVMTDVADVIGADIVDIRTKVDAIPAFPNHFADLFIEPTTGRIDLARWIGQTPNPLISGRVDSNAQATVIGYAPNEDPATLILGVNASLWNAAGTIGHAINIGGGAGGDPWGIDLSTYGVGTAGHTIYVDIKGKTDNLPASPAAVGSKMDLVDVPNATAITAIALGVWNTLLSVAFTAASLGAKIKDLVLGSDNKVIVSQFQPPIPVSTTGGGAYPVTVVVTSDGSTPVLGAIVRVSSNGATYFGTSDAFGTVGFSLDAAAYTLSITAPGYAYTPGSETVDSAGHWPNGSSVLTITLTSISTPAPPQPNQVTASGTVYNADGTIAAGAIVNYSMTGVPSGGSGIFSGHTATATADGSGHVSIPMFQNSVYRVWYQGGSPVVVNTGTSNVAITVIGGKTP